MYKVKIEISNHEYSVVMPIAVREFTLQHTDNSAIIGIANSLIHHVEVVVDSFNNPKVIKYEKIRDKYEKEDLTDE